MKIANWDEPVIGFILRWSFSKKKNKAWESLLSKTYEKKFEKALFSEIMEKKIRVKKKNKVWESFFSKNYGKKE